MSEPNTLARALSRRLAKNLNRWGQTLTVRGGGGSDAPMTVKGRVSVMPLRAKYDWFRSSETADWPAPAYLVTLPGDFVLPTTQAPPQPGDVVDINGVTHTVRKTDRPLLADVPMRLVLYVSR